jgi:hypothetical protein
MITTLDALQAHTLRLAERHPRRHTARALSAPGITHAERDKLRLALPALPRTYLDCIQRVNPAGVSIGYFQLSPGCRRSGDLVNDLIVTNTDPSNPFIPFYGRRGMYEVARLEADPICVARQGSTLPAGTVAQLDICTSPKVSVLPLAPDFLTLLLLAGNLDAIRDNRSTTGSSGVAAFATVLDSFDLNAEVRAAWTRIAVYVVGP